MTNRIVAFLGLSGVGKSTTLSKLASVITFQHHQASAIIKRRRARLEDEAFTKDDLRKFSIDDNQELLIEGFRDALHPSPRLAILDGHSAIETRTGVALIEPSVFAAIGVEHLIFLADNPDEIALRRHRDRSRERPPATEEDIVELQNTALIQAELIARELDIAMTVLRPGRTEELARLLNPMT